MESDSKLICRRGRHHFTYNLEMRGVLQQINGLSFAYNRSCLDVHSYAELWIESDRDIFSHLECKKVSGRA